MRGGPEVLAAPRRQKGFGGGFRAATGGIYSSDVHPHSSSRNYTFCIQDGRPRENNSINRARD
jgi:hypothetical protein